MQFRNPTTCLCVVLFIGTTSATISEGPTSPNLYPIGSSSDGKHYYGELVPARSWFEAKDYCASLNMSLASVTSAAQYEALQVKPSASFAGDVWVSGRDALSEKQFMWSDTEDPVEIFPPVITFQRVSPQQACLSIHPADTLRPYYANYACRNKFGTLCEQ